jgi:crotonobetainyl-CoA:carnitine CoA-transferase CaiB-like acyl-CoA transferase
MDRPELGEDPRYAKTTARAARRDEVNALVACWAKSLPLADLLARCDMEQVPVSKLLSISDIFKDPQYKARGNMVRIDDPRAGELTLPSAVPRLTSTPAQLRHAGPALGQHNQEIFGTLLGLSAEAIAGLSANKTI